MRRIVMAMAVLLALLPLTLQGQAPVGFNYQAAIYQDGAPVANRKVDLKLQLVDAENTVYYTETRQGVQTDAAGLVSVVIGESNPAELSEVPWGAGMWVAAYVNVGAGEVPLGRVKLQAVPYALHASAGMTIQAPKDYPANKPIFQVRDENGNALFSISKHGVTVFTQGDDDDRGVRGGFAVRSRTASGEIVDRMVIGDGVAFNVEDGGRGVRGGFAVHTRTQLRGKIEYAPRLTIGSGSVNLFVEESQITNRAGGVRGGFAVHLNRARSIRNGGEELHYTEAQPLMFLGERESFMTIGKTGSLCDGSVQSTFSVRNRCELDNVIMQVTPDGQVQAVQTGEIQVVENVVSSEKVSFEASGQAVLSALDRWWAPYNEIQIKKGSSDQGNLQDGFRLELPPGLKKYLSVEAVKIDKAGNTRLGLRIKPDMINTVLQAKDNVNGKMRVTSESDPTVFCDLPVEIVVGQGELVNPGFTVPFYFEPGSSSNDGEYLGDLGEVLNLAAVTLLNEGIEVLEITIVPEKAGLTLSYRTYDMFPYGIQLAPYFPQAVINALPASDFDADNRLKGDPKLHFKDKVTGLEGEAPLDLTKHP